MMAAKGSEPPGLGLLLHYLVFVGDVQLGDVREVFAVPVADRQASLESLHRPLAERYKHGRGYRFRANDRTWDWVASHFGQGLDRGSSKIRLQLLEALARVMRRALDQRTLSLPELLPLEGSPDPEPVERAIERAYLQLTGGRYQERALLKDVRTFLRGYSKDQIDTALKNMRAAGRVHLIEADLPGEREPEHALREGASQAHLMYMRGAS